MDIYGKVVEIILVPGTDKNDYFDYFIDITKKLLLCWELPWGRNAIPQNNKRKSIIINNNNEIWICQFLYFPSIDKEYESVIHMNSQGQVDLNERIPNSDECRCGTSDLWAVFGEFICIPMNVMQVKHLEQMVSKNSNGVFSYQHSYHDVRSYSLGRSATMQEIAMMLSEDINKITIHPI